MALVVAMSLCVDMGLHRRPSTGQVPEFRRRLWRRIWWCCFHRDRWIALGLGRPIRIHNRDCDVERVSASDLAEDTSSCQDLSDNARAGISAQSRSLPLFLHAVTLSICLDEVIAYQSQIATSPTSAMQLALCEAQLSSWREETTSFRDRDLSDTLRSGTKAAALFQCILNIMHQ